MNKILYVSEYYPPIIFGGGEISAQQLVESVKDKGHEVMVLSCMKDKEYHIIEERKTPNNNLYPIFWAIKTGKRPDKLIENIKRYLYSHKSAGYWITKLDEIFNFDIIHCLNCFSPF